MTKKANGKGALRWSGGRAHVRLVLGAPFGRRTFVLAPNITTESGANARRDLLSSLAARLRVAGRLAAALPLLDRLASRESERELRAVTGAIETLIKGEASPLLPEGVISFRELARQWTENELSARFPDHIPKRNHDIDRQRLGKHVLPVIGEVPVADGSFTLDHAQEVMRRLPAALSAASRRHVAHLIHRLLRLAVFPLRMLSTDPIPKGWMPLGGARKALSWLYPSEDAQLLGSAAVPLAERVLYGFLDREGMRAGEAELLERTDLDLALGVVRLDENKTDDPRAWALRPDVTRALKAWLALRDAAGDTDPRVFPVSRDHQADRFRRHLEKAGITRPELFERTAARQPIRIHDLRAGFVTVALALGRSEAWISDRTGHKSHTMIARYQRAARTANELNLGDFAALDVAVPELRADGGDGAEGQGSGGGAEGAEGEAPTQPGSSPDAARGASNRREPVAKRLRLRRFVRPRAMSPVSGSSGVTLVRVQVPPFAQAQNHSGKASIPEEQKEALSEGLGLPRGYRPDASGLPPDLRVHLARLAGELAGALGADDLDAARALAARIGEALAPLAPVIDLDSERVRRLARR